jgi:pimeloyl-ACP methyl ester carboxylesterase
MLARAQQLLLLGFLASLGAWIWVSVEYLYPAWVSVGVLAMPSMHAGTLAFEFMLMYRANRLDPEHPLRVRGVFTAWCAETLISARVFYWDQPFRSHVISDQLAPTQGGRAVVLIHGLLCNRGFWNPWMRKLRRLGIPYVAVTLEPVFGTIDDGSDAIDAAVRQATQATGMTPLIVTHSMGGLSVRAWLRARSAEGRVHHIITIAAPHQGTALARYATSDTAKRMRIGSRWLTALAADEPKSRYRLFTCFYGHCDNIVFPTNCATLPGADNRHVASAAHIQMACRDEVFLEAVRWLSLDAEKDSDLVRRPGRATG